MKIEDLSEKRKKLVEHQIEITARLTKYVFTVMSIYLCVVPFFDGGLDLKWKFYSFAIRLVIVGIVYKIVVQNSKRDAKYIIETFYSVFGMKSEDV